MKEGIKVSRQICSLCVHLTGRDSGLIQVHEIGILAFEMQLTASTKIHSARQSKHYNITQSNPEGIVVNTLFDLGAFCFHTTRNVNLLNLCTTVAAFSGSP